MWGTEIVGKAPSMYSDCFESCWGLVPLGREDQFLAVCRAEGRVSSVMLARLGREVDSTGESDSDRDDGVLTSRIWRLLDKCLANACMMLFLY